MPMKRTIPPQGHLGAKDSSQIGSNPEDVAAFSVGQFSSLETIMGKRRVMIAPSAIVLG